MAIPLNHLTVGGDFFGQAKRSAEGKRTARQNNWVRGWWENIAPEPVFIQDKWHLKAVCQAEGRRTGRTIIPRAFAKAKSNSRGIEWTF